MRSSDSQSLVSLLIIQDIQRRLYQEKKLLLLEQHRREENGSKQVLDNGNDNPRKSFMADSVASRLITSTDNNDVAFPSLKKLCNPISEILDTRTRGLLQVANCKGYVMSNQMVSAVIAQVAEERDMNPVLGELLSCTGSEMH